MDRPDIYLKKAEAAERAAETAEDDSAKKILKTAAERWRQLAEFARRKSNGKEESDD
jgi:hypothetical protein